MGALLQSLNAIPEVLGSVLFAGDGSCQEVMMPSPYDEPLLLGQVMREVHAAVDLMENLSAAHWNGFVLRYQDGCLVLRTIDSVTALVLAGANVNLTMLNVGFNVVALKLARPMTHRDTALGPYTIAPPLAAASVLEPLAKAFARYVGPMAKVLIQSELSRLGAGASPTPQQLEELVGALVRRIDPAKQSAFHAEAHALVRR
jgi:predicted regulator of Ras-like GTPase activity (Roadblock/LC7/MglB family)